MTEHKPRPATIVELPSRENGWSYVVETASPHESRVYLRGMGAPSPGKLGERGTITYTIGADFGLYFWTREEANTDGHESG